MTSETAAAAPRRRCRLQSILVWLRGDTRALLSLLWLVGLLVLGALAPLVLRYDPTAQDFNNLLMPPDRNHWLGTDDLGRDVFVRLIYGAPLALYSSLLATGVALIIGLPLGLVAGYVGRRTDEVISRVLDTILSFPSIILAVGITGALGIGLTNGMIAIGIVFSPILARIVRAQTMIVRSELYVDAARCFGSSTSHIIWKHLLPNVIQPVIVQVTLLLAASLLAEASLSFLGLGVQPPTPSWGGMLARAYSYLEIAPEQMYVPGLAILLTALAFNALGESLRVALDPSQRRS